MRLISPLLAHMHLWGCFCEHGVLIRFDLDSTHVNLWCVFSAKMITPPCKRSNKHTSGMNRHASGQTNMQAVWIVMQAVRTKMEAMHDEHKRCWSGQNQHASGMNVHTIQAVYRHSRDGHTSCHETARGQNVQYKESQEYQGQGLWPLYSTLTEAISHQATWASS